ncbi:transposase [Aquamicrobium ahrensii]|uniref:transposase n=1 Tax=Aquamicrobium ahrensii TaxID=469551 RepID=UPI0036204759
MRCSPEIGPVSVAMLIAEMTELGRMTAGEAAMTGLAPTPHDSGTMRGKRRIVGGRRALRHVVKRLEERSKPHKLIIIAIARRLLPIANAVLKPPRHGDQIQSLRHGF